MITDIDGKRDVEEFPRSSLGKVLKQKLISQYSGLDLTSSLRGALGRPD